MNPTTRPSLDHYLTLAYPFRVTADPDGGYVVDFPDLPGCMTQVETGDEIGPMAEEIRVLWIEAAYEQGLAIPDPSHPEEYSGKFNLRLPRSLHRTLAEAAERDGISLNQYAVMVLAAGAATRQVEHVLAELYSRHDRLEQDVARLGAQVGDIHAQMSPNGVESAPAAR